MPRVRDRRKRKRKPADAKGESPVKDPWLKIWHNAATENGGNTNPVRKQRRHKGPTDGDPAPEENDHNTRAARKRQLQAHNNDESVAKRCRSSARLASLQERKPEEIPVQQEQPHKQEQISQSRETNSNMCHQCQRNDKGRVVRCQRCRTKRFCVPCMSRWYPHMSEKDFAENCPVCQVNCNCKGCLRMKGVKKGPQWEVSEEDKVKSSFRVVHFLLPWLKEFHQQQMLEKSIEADIQGVPASHINVS